jgi:hypothetical protein
VKTGKITSVQTFNEDGEPTGMDITAQYLDKEANEVRNLSFHYDFFTTNVKGMVDKLLQSRLNGYDSLEHFSNVEIN